MDVGPFSVIQPNPTHGWIQPTSMSGTAVRFNMQMKQVRAAPTQVNNIACIRCSRRRPVSSSRTITTDRSFARSPRD